MPAIVSRNPRPENSRSADVLGKSANGVPRRLAALAAVSRKLSSPPHPLHGIRQTPPALPENVICFQRTHINDLNHPERGRALHHRHVLVVPLRGCATVCVDDRQLALEPGRGLVILPYQFHHYVAAGDRRLHWLFVTFEYAEGVLLERLRNSLFPLTAALAGQLRQLIRDQRNPAEAGAPELRLALLLSQIRPIPGRGAMNLRCERERSLSLKVNHALQCHRPLTPTIRQLAAELGMSPSHLRARFRASCGISLGRHMREQRLERARGLLRMNDARITEIAEQCGFSTVHSFSRAFRLAYGVSPRAFRRNETPDADARQDGSPTRASGALHTHPVLPPPPMQLVRGVSVERRPRRDGRAAPHTKHPAPPRHLPRPAPPRSRPPGRAS